MHSQLDKMRRDGRRAAFAILFFLCLLIAAIVAVTHARSAQHTPPQAVQPTTELKLVSTPWPPFTNPPGSPRFALDLVEEALGRGSITARTTIVEPARFTALLLSGEFDGSAAAWKNDERAKVLLYSQPYLENRLILVGRKGTDVAAPTLVALARKRVAIVEGYAYGDIETMGPVFVPAHSEEDSISRLLAGTVDYVLMDELVVQYILDHYAKEAKSKLALGPTPLLIRPLHLAVRRTLPDAESIISRFNSQLRNMIADRTYHRLLHVAWIRADVDGDGIEELVPQSDRAGPAPPKSSYSLFAERPSPTEPIVPDMNKPGFYVGGTTYPDWAAVPDKYKIPPSPVKVEEQDPARNTASIFKFVWK
jgi:polar amino acid transport system substrate-binding protein